ncbi:hypothetical protein THIOSC13_100002 [uncultured Thiomicrorhabdus sp.]
MKVYIDQSEWYPVFSLSEDVCDVEVDMSDEDIKFIQSAFSNFDKAQEMLIKYQESAD